MSEHPKALSCASLEDLIVTRTLPFWIASFAFVVTLGCDPGSNASEVEKAISTPAKQCTKAEVRVGEQCVAIPQIKLNTVGFLVGRVKRATVPAPEGVTTFQVVDNATQQSAYDGVLAEATKNEDTADTTRIADFSGLDTPGTYVLKVDGLIDSPTFSIGENVYDEALQSIMLGLYGLRCGVALEFEHQGQVFKHAACHLHDAKRGAEERDGTGGWHDAGDYGKYTINAAFALAFTLKAWEDFGPGLASIQHIPNHDGALPAWLAESKFQLDQILKMQFSDGSVSHMIGPYNETGTAPYPASIMPESDLYTRAFSDASTPATADFAAVTAMAARVFREFDAAYADRCLAAAQQAQAYLDLNTTYVMPALKSHFTHDAYASRSDTDDRFWALTELWRTTGDSTLLTRVESTDMSKVASNFDWDGVQNMGVFSYLQTKSDVRNPDTIEQAKAAVIRAADQLVTATEKHAYGRGIGATYYWGSNGVLARSAITLFLADSLAPSQRYRDTAVQQIDYLLGRNPFGRSFVTGVGYLPALNPHHRPSQADRIKPPWPGLLVGGPNSSPGDDPILATKTGVAAGLMWFDDAGSYAGNEVAINWNTALAYALAGFHR